MSPPGAASADSGKVPSRTASAAPSRAPAATPSAATSTASGRRAAPGVGTSTAATTPPALPKHKPPANDTARNALLVGALPARVTVDVTGARLDQSEAGLALDCGFPTSDRAVWYRYDDPDGLGFVVDASGSDHPVGLALLGGDPRDNVLMGCSDGSGLTASAGPTGPFHVAVLSDARDGASRVEVRFRALEPEPAGAVTLDQSAQLDAGMATLSGTYTCSGGGAVSASLSGQATQAGRNGIATPVDAICDGTVHRWTLVVSGPTGFEPGPADAQVTLSTCRSAVCSHVSAQASVLLAAG